MRDLNYIEIDEQLYVSVKELERKGYRVNPFASLSTKNIPQYNNKGEMIDLLIWEPILEISILKDDSL
jgi:hypothetical protein